MSGIDDLDWDLSALLDELVEDGELEEGTREHGIALKVVHEGYDSLSPKQRYVYDKKVAPLLEELGEQQYWAARAASAPP